ncbi:hypothetical protein [Myceligenerans pegani]|uniref:Lysyl-tRNA synthetase n=1 Tax=Myceligenerans pegani TaxID=2776917 RepID=A0ABR9MVM9_9MICO|nr:hypothetical protein [Myceligenerans sp. TRM 65318]MBE1875170.1 hypothetical protein [Myceligenerans sp. TRM 65318]MBE3017441.1 hypothetical protein [Myceligenerans sp. TRM 65318]
MDTFGAVIAGLLPSIGVGVLFWFAMRKIMRADRDERLAMERMGSGSRDGAGDSTATPAESASDGVVSSDNP